jgi:hypothetical protein
LTGDKSDAEPLSLPFTAGVRILRPQDMKKIDDAMAKNPKPRGPNG